MTVEEFDQQLAAYLHRTPFVPFRVRRGPSWDEIVITDPDTVAYRKGFALRAKPDLNDDHFYYNEVSGFELVPEAAVAAN
jgi:hypothetical protein